MNVHLQSVAEFFNVMDLSMYAGHTKEDLIHRYQS